MLVNTGYVFSGIAEAAKLYNIPRTDITACCRGRRKSAGKSSNGEKLVWSYIEN